MKNFRSNFFVASLVLFFLSTKVSAHSGHEEHEQQPARPPAVSILQGAKSCSFVGIKGVREYVRASSLKCFAKRKDARKKGYVDAFTSSFKVHSKHIVVGALSAQNEVTPSSSTATGECVGTMDHSTFKLRLVCSHNVVNFTAAHLHMNAAGLNGPMICASPSTTSPVAFDCQLDAVTHAALHDKELYINIHSTDFPDGEIRGQLEPEL